MQVPYGATLLQRKDKLSPALVGVKPVIIIIQKTFTFLYRLVIFFWPLCP